MSTTKEKFIAKCYEIVLAKPVYVKGHSSKATCDCIGMIKYGLKENGVSFTTSGSNWTFRNQVKNIRRVFNASNLQVGDVIFKALEPGSSGYALPSKYLPGGAGYNGDLNDYCHIGVVKSVSPLEIIHMTGPTAKTDTKIGKWKYAAELKEYYISDSSSETPASTSNTSTSTSTSSSTTPATIMNTQPTTESIKHETSDAVTYGIATVTADTGRWVKMRKEPSKKCSIYDEIPIGATVTVEESGDEWSKISYGKRKGWFMMSKFLKEG